MSRLPSLVPREVIAALKRAGFEERRQRGNDKMPKAGRVSSFLSTLVKCRGER